MSSCSSPSYFFSAGILLYVLFVCRKKKEKKKKEKEKQGDRPLNSINIILYI